MIARALAVTALSVALGGLYGPAVATADSGDFLNRIQNLGWYDDRGDTYLLDNGYRVCRMMDRGFDGLQVAREVYVNTGTDVTANDAAWFVIIAVEELCPWHDHRGEAGPVA